LRYGAGVRTPVLGIAVALLSSLAAACRPNGTLLMPHPPRLEGFSDVARGAPLDADENIRPTLLQRNEQTSAFVVRIRDRETPHVHTRYDLTVVMLEGKGTLWLDGAPLAMHCGDVALIPKGTPHYFVNEGSDPAAALVVFAPPFDGPDQQPVPPR
jgi:quercetin dioxygenase-like cupin family protein